MSGYNNYNMSNNALLAYKEGEKPISKWTKKVLMSELENYITENNLKLNVKLISKLTLKELRKKMLYVSSWHHSSKFYNVVHFYKLDESYIYDLTNEDIIKLTESAKNSYFLDFEIK